MNKYNNVIPFRQPKKEFSETMNMYDKRNFSSSIPGNSYNIQDENCLVENDNLSYDENNEGMMKDKAILSEKTINIFLATIAVTVAVLAIIISIAAWTIDKNIDSVNSNVNSKFDSINTEIKAINQRLDYQEKMNTLIIENEVNKKINPIGK